MKLWVEPWRVAPPRGQSIMARYGCVICYVGLERFVDQWVHLANGREEKIGAPPDYWYCDAEYANANMIKNAQPPPKKVFAEKTVGWKKLKRQASQLGLSMDVG